MSVLGMLAWFAAAASLWFGARRHDSAFAQGYRWLSGAAALYCAALVIQQLLGEALSAASGLSFADLPSLLAVAVAAVGIAKLASAERLGQAGGQGAQRSGRASGVEGAEDFDGQDPSETVTGSVLPGLADGYVMAVALLVIGWVTLFSAEFHRSGERPGTFLLALIHPLADLAVLGALLPMVTAAWRRTMLPYLSLLAAATGDALAVGQRVFGGHVGVAAQLMTVVAAVLLGAAPWWAAGMGWSRRTSAAAAATIIAALTAAGATLVVIGAGLAGAPASGVALVVAGGAGVLVLAVRVFMLVNQNELVFGIWRESSQSLRDLASRISDLVLICDLEGVISYASPAVGDYGYAPADLTGRQLLDFVHPEDRDAVLAAVRLALTGPASADRPAPADQAGSAGSADAPGRVPARLRAADGTWRHIESTVLRYQVPGAPDRMLVTVRDISDQVALRQQVAHLTFHDGLTGLPNRAYVEERTRDVLRDVAAARRTGVILLDLDRFTAVNDSVGHGAGDLVLAQAARRLRAIVPVHDTVARWGSDEFAVLVEDAGGVQEVAEIAERLAGAVAAEPFRVAGQQIALTASVGVALAGIDTGALDNPAAADHRGTPDHPEALGDLATAGDPGGPDSLATPGDRGTGQAPSGTTDPDGAPELVLRNADVAMSRAKEAGGDRVEVYAAHMHADVVHRLQVATDLQRAISNGELALQYQPIVDLTTCRVTGAEALVRWWRGDKLVSPREFLGAAEESGLIVPLGEWVLREACAQGAAWRRASWDVGVSVNLSARQITAPTVTAQVAAILADTGLPPDALTVDVSERILLDGDRLILDRLADLHHLGVRTAIDDFGTGQASLAHLRQLPVDSIKIDPSFLAGLGHDETVTLLTRTVVRLGRDLGLQVIAEGIEQPRQLNALQEMGCHYGQGFLLAGPMAAAGVEAMIKEAQIRTPGGTADEPCGRPVSECETTPVSG
jgi:diguanylate cyclase (GGDEF)-like protein